MCANKVKVWKPTSPTTLTKVLKTAYAELEEVGAVAQGTADKMSVSSLRRGGNTVAAAEGIRRTIRQKHGRWRSTSMPDEYDDLAPGDEAAVSAALQRRVARSGGASTQRDSSRRQVRQRFEDK